MRDQGRAVRARVGRMVRELRLLRGWSQEQLAERANSSPKHVGRIERGQVNVGVDGLAALARALSVDVSDLFSKPQGRQPGAAIHVIGSDDVAHLENVATLVRRLTSRRARASRGSTR
jgi:transcriptional regulator with XRE-family HTH domain